MFDSVFDTPLTIAGPAIIGTLCLFAMAGLLLVRRFILPRLRVHIEDSEYAGGMLQSIMVFYGLAVALIAVGVSQNHSDVSKLLSNEATDIAALYRDVSGYPEPIRTRLQSELRDYTDQVIHGAWPLMAKGRMPSVGKNVAETRSPVSCVASVPPVSVKLSNAESPIDENDRTALVSSS